MIERRNPYCDPLIELRLSALINVAAKGAGCLEGDLFLNT